MSFRRFKDRIWFSVDAGTKRLAVSPAWIQSVGYGLVRAILWAAYAIPGGPLQKSASAWSANVGVGPPSKLYGGFAHRFIQGLKLMERLRLGHTDEIDGLLKIPDKSRLETIVARRKGLVLVMPHCHASVLMVRGLAAIFPVLLLVRESANQSRADAIRPYYDNVGCELFDVRRSAEIPIARAVLGALRKGKIVIGVVDRISEAPDEGNPAHKVSDTVGVLAFGQPIGAPAWPARFSGYSGAPVLPAMVELQSDAIVLHLGPEIIENDPNKMTQAWISSLQDLVCRFPMDWGFVYDKNWSRVLRSVSRENSEEPLGYRPKAGN